MILRLVLGWALVSFAAAVVWAAALWLIKDSWDEDP